MSRTICLHAALATTGCPTSMPATNPSALRGLPALRFIAWSIRVWRASPDGNLNRPRTRSVIRVTTSLNVNMNAAYALILSPGDASPNNDIAVARP